MAEMPESQPVSRERNFQGAGVGASNVAATKEVNGQALEQLMETMVERENMQRAYERVKSNAGAPGIDAMTVDDLKDHISASWKGYKAALLEDRYEPQPVRRVEIPKPGGKGKRNLGIPVVMDRLIQQALLQVLTPIFDPEFSDSSFGFREGKSAHDALKQAREIVNQGHKWVVDIDLEKFFDRVNHDILMSRIARKVKDKRVLRLIRKFLQAGVMENGLVTASTEGTPQGGPLSPLLSNIMLDDLDKELEKRGHLFCRYADDCNIFVKSELAGKRVMESLTDFLETKLKLKVNREKSAVDKVTERKFLGYTFM